MGKRHTLKFKNLKKKGFNLERPAILEYSVYSAIDSQIFAINDTWVQLEGERANLNKNP